MEDTAVHTNSAHCKWHARSLCGADMIVCDCRPMTATPACTSLSSPLEALDHRIVQSQQPQKQPAAPRMSMTAPAVAPAAIFNLALLVHIQCPHCQTRFLVLSSLQQAQTGRAGHSAASKTICRGLSRMIRDHSSHPMSWQLQGQRLRRISLLMATRKRAGLRSSLALSRALSGQTSELACDKIM